MNPRCNSNFAIQLPVLYLYFDSTKVGLTLACCERKIGFAQNEAILMTSLNQQESSGQATEGRGRSRRWGLAILCALWLALLSPKVIFGVPDGNDGRHQTQAVPAAATPAPDSVIEFSAGSPVSGALTISPAQIDVPVGRKLSFRLTDQQGHAIHDATWMVSDFTVADLDSLDPPRIAAITPGQVTITAILGDQTVQAKINVVSTPQLSSVRNGSGSSTSKSR